MRCNVIYEDSDVLVIRKPAGLATQSAAPGQPDAVSELKKYLVSTRSQGAPRKAEPKAEPPYLGIIHRLDQPVEGLLVFAKTKRAASTLSKELSENELNKRYLAAVCGGAKAEEGELEDYLLKDGTMARVATENEKERQGVKLAKLKYRLLARKEGISLLEVRIETGRFHQIRVQLAHAGMPILGDRKYGTQDSKELGEKLGFQCVALAACSLEFVHPTTKKRLSFECKPDWEILFYDKTAGET